MKVILDPGAFMPERAHPTDAGLDLRTPTNAEAYAITGSYDVYLV